MKRINIWLAGGLGNILFQLNFGQRLKEQNYDVNYITNLTENNFITQKILKWKIHEPIYQSLFSTIEWQRKSSLSAFWACLAFFLSKKFDITFFGYSWEKKTSRSTNVSGYFQGRKLIESSFSTIHKVALDMSMELIRNDDIREKEVIHFRGRDSLRLKENIDLLRKSIEKFPNLTIITDHFTLAKRYAPQQKIISENAINDFKKMIFATDVLICSDSTFSFWAAVMNNTAKIYAPKTLIDQFGNVNEKIELFNP